VLSNIFKEEINIEGNFITLHGESIHKNQQHTNDAFTEKWSQFELSPDKEALFQMQREWYLELYGFSCEDELAEFLSTKKYIFDAGCGLGYKTKWYADLAPNSIVIGMDFSDACAIAAKNYERTGNLFFIKGDIANTPFLDGSIDYVNCDQVIMHTEVPEDTFAELARITKNFGGEFACYVYAKKALPRELLDDYFRIETKNLSNDQLWNFSKQLTQLGKKLTELNIEIEVPDIPLLGIKGGKQNIQRFIYWNFLKCYWNEDQGDTNSDSINFDWYSPSNAKRYSKGQFEHMVVDNNLTIEHFHEEEACYSGRFKK
jgi:SAM-dependent methyltransferase